MYNKNIRTVEVTRYVTPLREGGSLPAIVEADDGFQYVIKFRGAGQGKKALISELIGGELARELGLHMPELVFMELDDRFSKTEPDEEIQDLLKFSVGLNLGLHYLDGSITYDPLASKVDGKTASLVVLLDMIITNVDRTPKNANMLQWKNELWLIDHGASLYFHHNWPNWETHLGRTFPAIKDHVLLPVADQLDEAKTIIVEHLSEETVRGIVDLIPNDWLEDPAIDADSEARRKVYVQFIMDKISNIDMLLKEAKDGQ